MSNIYIIIVTYNGMHWLPKCFISCGGNHIIVVDNNSTDRTVSFIKSNYPGIILLEQTQNLGFGAANNIGIAYALNEGADYVFLLNQDAYLQSDTIDTLVKVHKANKDFGVISPIHLNGDGSKLDKNFSGYIKESDNLIYDTLQQKYNNSIYEVPFVNAAAWLIPRKTFVTIGGFDPVFYHYTEDDNYCQRLKYHHFNLGVVPKTFIYHDRGDRIKVSSITEKERLIVKERYFKHRWANINVEVDEDILTHKNDLLKLILKLYLKFKFKKASYYMKEYNLIKRIIPEILKSRKINSQIGNHYL